MTMCKRTAVEHLRDRARHYVIKARIFNRQAVTSSRCQDWPGWRSATTGRRGAMETARELRETLRILEASTT